MKYIRNVPYIRDHLTSLGSLDYRQIQSFNNTLGSFHNLFLVGSLKFPRKGEFKRTNIYLYKSISVYALPECVCIFQFSMSVVPSLSILYVLPSCNSVSICKSFTSLLFFFLQIPPGPKSVFAPRIIYIVSTSYIFDIYKFYFPSI